MQQPATKKSVENLDIMNNYELSYSFGFPSYKRYNLNMIDTENAIVAVGNTFQFVNIFTGKYTWLRAIGDGGIGAIAV